MNYNFLPLSPLIFFHFFFLEEAYLTFGLSAWGQMWGRNLFWKSPYSS